MTSRKSTFVLSAFLTVAGVACGGDRASVGGGGLPSSQSWFQATLGSVNTYRVTPTGSAPFDQTMTITAASAASVTRKTLGGISYLLATYSLDGGAVAQVGQRSYYFADDSPVPGTSVSYSPPSVVVPANTSAGQVSVSSSTVTTDTTTYTLTRTLTVNGIEPVTVPAGTFSALKVTILSESTSGSSAGLAERWFVRGIGMVKSVSWPVATPANVTTMELASSYGGGGGGGPATTLASGLMNAATVAVDATHVYWTESADGLSDPNAGVTSVKKVALAGGAVTTIASRTGQPNSVGTSSIGVAAEGVFWTESNATAQSLLTVGLGGGAVTTLATAATNYPNALALDATTVYFTDVGGGTNFGAVRAVPKGGGSPTDVATGLPGPWAIAVDSTSVYWTDTWDGAIRKAPKVGGSPTTLASGGSTATTAGVIAVDGSGVYFIAGGANAGDVCRVGLDGGAVTTLASPASAAALAIDAIDVYWADPTGAIYRVGKGGGSSSHVAVTGAPAAIAVDAANVYWSDGASIRKLAKW